MQTTKYGKAEHSIFTIEGFKTPTCIFFYEFTFGHYIEVCYCYDVDGNTLKHEKFTYISKKEFYAQLKEIEANLKGKIFVKRTWL